MLGLGLGINKYKTNTNSGPVYDPAYQTLLNQLIADGLPTPDSDTKTLDNQFVTSLGANLAAHSGLYLLGWKNATTSLYNWANPTDPTIGKCSYIGSMSSANWTANSGYNTVAASGLNTGIVPSTAPEIDADNCTLWMWVDGLSGGVGVNKDIYIGNAFGTYNNYMGCESGEVYSRINTNGANATEYCGSIPRNKSFIALKRISFGQVERWFDGVYVDTINKNYAGLSAQSMYLLALNIYGIYVPPTGVGVRCYAAGIGGDIDVANVYNALLTRKS